MRSLLFVAVMAVLLVSAGCNGGSSKPTTARAASSGQPIPVGVVTAEKRDLPVYLSGLGSVLAFNTVSVKSRIDGQLVQVIFKEGQYVKQGELLALIDPRPYEVALSQAQATLFRDQAQLRDARLNYERFKSLLQESGAMSQQEVDADGRDDQTKLAAGKLLTIDNQIDQSTGTGRLKAVFDNKDNILWPNQFVNVRLLLEVHKNSTVIPAVAVQRGPQGTFVFAVKPDKTVEVRPVAGFLPHTKWWS